MKVQLQAEKGSESPPEARERKSPPLIQFVRDVSDFWASKRDTGPLVDGSGLHCTATYTGHQGFPLLASTSCCLHECRKTSYYSIRSCFSFRKFLNVSGQEAEGHHKILPHFLQSPWQILVESHPNVIGNEREQGHISNTLILQKATALQK